VQPAYRFAIFFDSADGTASYEYAELTRPLTTGETVALPSGQQVVVTEIIKQSTPGDEKPGRARGHLRRPS
jgi:hypothetical protein